MAEKRRGLGRGLGALIPSGPSTDARPVDVFFPGAPTTAPTDGDGAKGSGETGVAGADSEAATTTPTSSTVRERTDGGTSTTAVGDDTSSGTTARTPGSITVDRATSTDGVSARPSGTGASTDDPTDTGVAGSGTATHGGRTAENGSESRDGTVPGVDRSTDDDGAGAHEGTEGQTSAGHTPEGQTSAGQTPEGQTSAGQSPEGQSPEGQSPEGPTPEGQRSGGQTSGGQTRDDRGLDRQVAEDEGHDVQAADGLVPVPGATFAEIPVTSIRRNPRQPRTVFDPEALAELVGSIQEVGVLQPVVVRPVDDGEDGVRYELIMGERRWRATREAGHDTIPAIVRMTEDGDLLRDALLENLHRSQLNPLEEAAAYQQLLDDFGCTHDELARRIHRSRPQITNTIRLLRLPPLVQRRVAAGVISAGHARALLGLADPSAMERLAQRIVAEGLSVRATEEIVALGGGTEERKQVRRPRPGERNAALDDLSSRLSDRFDTRVKVQLGAKKGRLTIEFASVQDLNRLLELMSPDDPGILR